MSTRGLGMRGAGGPPATCCAHASSSHESSRVSNVNSPSANRVDAAVADVRKHRTIAGIGDARRDNGRAHAGIGVLFGSRTKDPSIGCGDGFLHAVCVCGRLGTGLRPAERDGVGLAEELRDGFDREARGHFAGSVPTHAVSHDEQPPCQVTQEGILVVAPQ